jgi:hypothetical protein
MSTILDIPQEIYYLIAKYDLDLLDLGALIWSCKTLNERIGQDLPLQKFFLDNTHAMFRGPSGTPIRRKYVETKTAYGIRCNDPDGVLMSFPKLTPVEILKVLKVANNRINREMNRQVIIDEIYKADADKVLDFIIKSVIEYAFSKLEEKISAIVQIIWLFFGSYIDTAKLAADNAVPYINSIKTSKTAMALLKHMQEQQSFLYGNILISCSLSSSWSNSSKQPYEVLVSLVKLSESPNFKFDLNAPIVSEHSNEFMNGFVIPPLEFCVASNLYSCYHFLKKQGVKLEIGAPYLPLALYQNSLNTSTSLVAEFLPSGRYDINQCLPEYLGFRRPTTVLGQVISLNLKKDQLQHREHCFIELLLNNGAKLTKEEELEFLGKAPTHWAHKAAIVQQGKDYSSLPRRVKITFENQTSMEFGGAGNTLVLRQNGEFELVQYGTYMGHWIEGNQTGTIVCRSSKKKQYISWGSWGGTEEIRPDAQVHKFHVFRMYDDTVTVMPNNVPQDSYADMWRLQYD